MHKGTSGSLSTPTTPATPATLASRRALMGAAAAAAASATGILAAACGVQDAGGPTSAGAVKPSGKVTWSFWAVSQEQADGILAGIKQFQTEFPDVQVEASFVASAAYRDRMLSLVTAGTPPEVMQLQADMMPDYVAKGIVQRLDTFMKGDRTFKMDAYLPGGFMDRHQVFNGVPYGVPNQSESPRVLFYNKKRFAEEGIPLPSTLEQQGKWNWDAYQDAALRLSKGTSPDRSYGTREYMGVSPEQHSWVFLNGGKVLSDDLKTFVGDMPETTAAWQYQADLVLKHRAAPPPGENLGAGNAFVTGRIAMFVSGLWDAAPFVTIRELDYGVVPLPKNAKGIRKTVLKPNALTIPTLIKGPTATAAWELMKFIAGPTYQKGLIRDGLSLTNLKELVDYFHKNTPVRDPKVYTDALEKKEVVALPLFPKWADFNAIVTEEMNKVRSGAVNLQAAVGSIKPRVNDLLKA